MNNVFAQHPGHPITWLFPMAHGRGDGHTHPVFGKTPKVVRNLRSGGYREG